MEQLPLGEAIARRQRSPNSRKNIPLPVLILGAVAMVVLLFSGLVLIKMGTPAEQTEVETEITL